MCGQQQNQQQDHPAPEANENLFDDLNEKLLVCGEFEVDDDTVVVLRRWLFEVEDAESHEIWRELNTLIR